MPTAPPTVVMTWPAAPWVRLGTALGQLSCLPRRATRPYPRGQGLAPVSSALADFAHDHRDCQPGDRRRA